ncbi:DNA polymerase I [Alteromonas phage vB_AmeP_PT11-V19]|nr:DNA polymerase I [Alteromonas phage vB_AmeP_PT11-V19]
MRPFEHLPIPFPCDYDPGPAFFYKNIVNPLIPDIIKLSETGLHIDQNAVEDLRRTVEDVLTEVDAKLLRNPLVQKYQKVKEKKVQKKHYDKSVQAVRSAEHYLKDYAATVEHRTAVVNNYLEGIGKSSDIKDKWTVNDLKKYLVFNDDVFLQRVTDKSISKNNPHIKAGMIALAELKAELWNRPRYDKANSKAVVEPFNMGSDKQKQEFFSMLGIEPLSVSDKTGEGSWSRDNIEEIKKQTPDTETELHEFFDCLIDHSYGGIIKSNFLKAFDKFTIDNVLYGNVKLFGAKSFRPTSNSPNLLNMPSTKSKYAKPLKRSFVAPKGKLIYAIDLSALEDRVIANLSGDKNKINIFVEGLDGHSLNACGYFKDTVENLLGEFPDVVSQVKAFMAAVDADDKTIIKIRQKSKAPTFKLAYGGFPDAHKGGVITQEIFDNYHNLLYPGITDYRENYVLKTAHEQGYIHLGLGCRLYTDDANKDIRTLNNATVQFWSILTLIAINEINYRAKEAGLEERVIVCSTIYDSIYFYVDEDPEVIKWLNDTAVEVLCADYLKEQVVKNEAEGEIGLNWADLVKVKNGATVEDIKGAIEKVYE